MAKNISKDISKVLLAYMKYLKMFSKSRRLEPLVEIENWGYRGSTTSLVIPSLLICTPTHACIIIFE
jgi:hypothetical protein